MSKHGGSVDNFGEQGVDGLRLLWKDPARSPTGIGRRTHRHDTVPHCSTGNEPST